jgi:hypothetical protein
MIYNQEDLPFSKDGIVPDIIVNPHAIPSRMTIGQIMEAILGKACLVNGNTFGDATPFTDLKVDDITKILNDNNLSKYGNEILYNPRTGEQIQTCIFMGPTYYQRLKHMVSDKIHCLTADHDVLTENGWKSIDTVTMDDKVATLKDGYIVYDYPIKIHHYPDYKGKMYHIKNNNIDLNVTANHRMWVSTFIEDYNWSKYKLEKAEDIIGKYVKYQKNAELNYENYQFVLPAFDKFKEKIVNMDSWLIFFGIWFNQQNIESIKNVVSISNTEKYKETLYNTISKMDYSFYISKDEKLYIHNKQLANYLNTIGNESLPSWVWKLSQYQCQRLVYSMIFGFGNICSRYYPSSLTLSDEFMKLCLHAGWSANEKIVEGIIQLDINKHENRPAVNIENESILSKKLNKQQEYLYDFEGPVYCLSVPSHIFYVRRNGIPVWTGNSRGSNGPIVMLTRQPEIRVEKQQKYEKKNNHIIKSISGSFKIPQLLVLLVSATLLNCGDFLRTLTTTLL